MARVVAVLLFLICSRSASAQSSFINGLTHQGYDITADLPGSQQIRNIGSKRDGAGMCVFSAIEMAALHCGLEEMRGWRNWCAANYKGGGWPAKVDKCLADWFHAKQLAPIGYVQYQGRDPAKILDLIDKTGRMGCMTYGYSPRYGGPIQHMTNCVMFREKYAVVLDNNFPGEDRYEWMERKELVRRTIYPNASAWVFCWTPAAPPPSPRNLKPPSVPRP